MVTTSPIAMVVSEAIPSVNQINAPAVSTMGKIGSHSPIAPPRAGAPPAPRSLLPTSELMGRRPLLPPLPRCNFTPAPEPAPDPFISWLLEQAGLDPAAYRAQAMNRRVAACLRQLRVPSAAAARALLEERPNLLPRVINTILIGVTEFFRDRLVFDHLRRVSLPELIAGRGGFGTRSAESSGSTDLTKTPRSATETYPVWPR